MPFTSIPVQTSGSNEFVNISAQVKKITADSGIENGLCVIYVPHTTCGVSINEAADPDVVKDILMELNKIVPHNDNYLHYEGNSAAHIKTSMMGSSVSIPISGSQLTLGTWQGIYLCEFDGPRNRKVYIQLAAE